MVNFFLPNRINVKDGNFFQESPQEEVGLSQRRGEVRPELQESSSSLAPLPTCLSPTPHPESPHSRSRPWPRLTLDTPRGDDHLGILELPASTSSPPLGSVNHACVPKHFLLCCLASLREVPVPCSQGGFNKASQSTVGTLTGAPKPLSFPSILPTTPTGNQGW